MVKTREYILGRIKEILRTVAPGTKAILYGSQARGDAHKDSDWDILILVDQEKVTLKDEQRFRHKLIDVELETGQAMSTFVYSLKDWFNRLSMTPLFDNVQREGILL